MTAIQKWWTAQECAETAKAMAIKDVPSTKRGWTFLLDRKGLTGSRFCRPRDGSKGGGGYEYAFDALPQSFIAACQAQTYLAARKESRLAVQEKRNAIAAEMSLHTLDGRQREVMAARGAILTACADLRESLDITDSKAIDLICDRSRDLQRTIDTLGCGIDALREDEARIVLKLVRDDVRNAGIRGDFAPTVSLTAKTLETANDRRVGQVRISRRTLYAWMTLAHGPDGNWNPVALAPQKTKVERSPHENWWWAGFMEHYARPTKPSMKLALKWFSKTLPEGVKPPTYKQVKAAIEKLDEYEKYVGREGYLTLRNRVKYITRGKESLFPTFIYTADGKTFDAEVAHPVTGQPFRPELTTVLDVSTRKGVGFAISLKENVIAVTEALGKAAIAHGIPAIFYVDRGAGYKNKAMDADATGLMARLGITKMHSLPYNSQARGVIERFNAQWNDLAREFPTYVGVDMDKEARKAAFDTTRRDVKEFGTSRLLVSWEDFRARCAEFLDEYNNTPHSELPRYRDPETGRWTHPTPNEMWAFHAERNADQWEPEPVDPTTAEDLFRPYKICTVRRGLIELHTNEYFHEDLDKVWHQKRVIVGYDLDDAAQAWVRAIDTDGDGNEIPGRLICVARNSGNKVDYVARTAMDLALEKRVKGQLRRLDDKRAAVEAQLDHDRFIDHEPGNVVPFRFPGIEIEAEAIEPPAPAIEQTVTRAVLPTRPKFRNEIELALYAEKEGLGKLTESQRSVLRSFLNNHTDRETLRLHGVNLKLLEEMFRSAA